jgi:glycosyltransferase involved in cell wall biosynthesis
MVTFSLCMIVKNEEKNLARCLDGLADIMDEIIIVDTGSTDSTRDIAAGYTDHIYDFGWTGSFADARNFSFSKATCDYIYCADADEVLDSENQARLRILKENLLPEIEIVQMYYANQLENGTVYNFDKELRPKLFRRLRTFTWIESIHETVRLEPVVFDSDIVIIHRPGETHAERDLQAFVKMCREGEELSPRLAHIYAQELYLSGDDCDFQNASPYFMHMFQSGTDAQDEIEAACVVAHAARVRGDSELFYQYGMKAVMLGSCSEICCEFGEYYVGIKDFAEARVWFYNGAYETQPLLDIHMGREIPLNGLADCSAAIGDHEAEKQYRDEAGKAEDELGR